MARLSKEWSNDDTEEKSQLFPEMKIRKKNLQWIESMAKLRGESRNKVFIDVLYVMMTLSPKGRVIKLYGSKTNRRKNSYDRDVFQPLPKFRIPNHHYEKRLKHIQELGKFPEYEYMTLPSYYLNKLKEEKEKSGVSYTVLVDELILSYRRNFDFIDQRISIDLLLSPDEQFDYKSTNETENFINFLSNTGGVRDRAINSLTKTLKI